MNRKGPAQVFIVLIVVAVVAISAVGYFGIVAKKATNKTEPPAANDGTPPAVVSSPTPSQPSQPGHLDTSTWQTYRNPKYGFEVNYPGDILQFSKKPCGAIATAYGDGEEVLVDGDAIYLTKSVTHEDEQLGKKISFDEFEIQICFFQKNYQDIAYNFLTDSSGFGLTPVSVDSHKALFTTIPDENSNHVLYYVAKNQNSVFVLHFASHFEDLPMVIVTPIQKRKELFDQILSTFKFIN